MTSELPADPSPPPIRVAIVEDDRALRQGLAMLIDGTPGFRCRETYGSVEAALEARPAPRPDVILLDIGLPGVPGSTGVAFLRERLPESAILMLTVFDDQGRIFESLCHGACGYLLKRTPPARLLEAIREAHDGGSPMSPEIARRVVELFRQVAPGDPAARAAPALTGAERRLLVLLVEGLRYQECADRLEISVHTVRSCIRSIYDKLQVHSKSAAVARAIRERLV
ncbi:MAG: response regulator transcription factor [Thermoanaerobaculia bacterium]